MASGGKKSPREEEDDEMDVDNWDDDVIMESEDMDEILQEKDDQNELIECNSESRNSSRKWGRPAVTLNSKKDSLIFQQLEVDFHISFPLPGMTGDGAKTQVPVVTMYGVTREGNSATAHVHGFFPYFFVQACPGFKSEDCNTFREALNTAVVQSTKSAQEVKEPVIKVEVVKKQTIYGYHKNQKVPFLKITVLLPKYVSVAQGVLVREFSFPGYPPVDYQCFETNVDYCTRFMVDLGIQGCSWVEFPAGKYTMRSDRPPSNPRKRTRCQLEVDISWEDLIAHPVDGDWSIIAPFRIFSFDIECAGRKGVFPEAEKDPVIQIANVVQRQGDKEPFLHVVLTWKSCAPIVGVDVISFDTEEELLRRWAELVREVDPDIITGYNIQNFDLTYLLNRARKLNLRDFPYLGRVTNLPSVPKQKVLQSKQMGKKEYMSINIDGRVQFDLLPLIVKDHKLRSYRLDAVSFHFLKEQKEDVHYSQITDLHNGTAETRQRLAKYCLKDALLPLRLMEKLMIVITNIEMARVTGVTMTILLTRGQQVKVVSQLLRKAKERDFVIPVRRAEGGEEFEGATVIEPKKGYYDVPIATLDFSSLYPSIMMAHNLCYSTLLCNSVIEREGLTPDQYIKTPSGNLFAKKSVLKGMLPEILENLLAARKKAKQDLKKETDPFKRQVLDGRQLALKISANSVYGFTGAQVGRLPCVEISQSVTSFGRMMIEQTKQQVEELFSIKNGYEHNAEVIYGDTDSVMCRFGVSTVAEAMKLGKEAAEKISATFQDPIKLEFEKVYYPYLLINKKRYAGLYWTRPEFHDKVDCKGIETVRRDNCPLVANLINSCLKKILIDRDTKGAEAHAKQVISDLLCNRIDISQLVITKELTKKDEEYTAKAAHNELAKKMRKRDPGSAPRLGDRVPFVIIAATKGTAAYLKAEHPMYVQEYDIPIDTQYYLDNVLSKPLLRLFEPILGDQKANSELLKGAHTRAKTKVTAKVGGLSAFTQKKETCLGCKVPLDSDDGAVCQYCKPSEAAIYQKEIAHFNCLEEKFCRLWSQCQICQNNFHEEIICQSEGCPIFYMRTKVQKDLGAQDKVVSRFRDLEW